MAGGLLTDGLGFAPYGPVIDGFTASSTGPLIIPDVVSIELDDEADFADVDPEVTTLLN